MQFEHQQEVLESGLRLVTVPMSVPSVTVLAMVGAGSRYEGQRVNGISHFLEHMVFKGTAKYPTALSLSSAVDGVGAEFNAFTGKEYTGFYVKAGSAHLALAIEVIGEMLFRPRLEAAEIEREKGVIIEEINMYEDQPIRDIGNVFDSLLYSSSSLGWDVIGTKATIREMRKEDFEEHMERWYRPQNMVLGIAGDGQKISDVRFQMLDLVQKYFKTANSKRQMANRKDWEKFRQDKPQVKIKPKQTEQAHFILGVRGLPRGHQNRYVMAVLSTILGGNMSSRLFIEVRERRGLAYYVRSGVEAYQDTGSFGIQAGVELSKIDEAVAVIVEELGKVKNKGRKGIKASEVIKSKEYLKGKLLLDWEDSREVAGEYVEDWLAEGKVRTPAEIIRGIEAVTLPEVERLAKELLVQPHLNLAAIGPYSEPDKFEKLLQL
jgi:predicted Zn-dependent peptidase